MNSIFRENKNNINTSEISMISFCEDKANQINNNPQTVIGPFDLSSQNNDSFFLNYGKDKDNQFTYDSNDNTYKQFKYVTRSNSLYDELKEKAVQKLTNLKKELQGEESEEEEELSEYEDTNDENDDNISNESEKENKEIISPQTTMKVIIIIIMITKIRTKKSKKCSTH